MPFLYCKCVVIYCIHCKYSSEYGALLNCTQIEDRACGGAIGHKHE